MTDGKDLIDCLESTIHNAKWANKDYTSCDVGFLNEILMLLKAQEPRLLTFDDLLAISGTDRIVYVERRTKTYYNEMAFVYVEKVYRDSVVFHGQKDIFGHNRKDYGKTWRCWSDRPTDVQREETPWTT